MRITWLLSALCLAMGCADQGSTSSPTPAPRPSVGSSSPAAPEVETRAVVTAEIAGKWRSSEENRIYPEDNGRRQVMDVEFRKDGTYRQRKDTGFGILDELSGTYSLTGSDLGMQPDGSRMTFRWTVSIDEEQLVMTRDTRPGWKHILIRTDEPHPALEALPPRPRTVNEAVTALEKHITDEDRQKIRAADDPDVIGKELGMDLLIACACGLGRGGEELLAACGSTDHREASKVILRAYWKSLRETR